MDWWLIDSRLRNNREYKALKRRLMTSYNDIISYNDKNLQLKMRKYNSNKMLRGIIDFKKPSSALSLFAH